MHLLLVGLVALGGVTSQSFMDIITIVIFIIFLRDAYNKKLVSGDFKLIGIEWAFVGYFLTAIVSLYVNGKPPVPWYEYLSKFNWVLNLYILIYAFNKAQFNSESWLKYFNFAFLLPNIYAVSTYFAKYDFLLKREVDTIVGLVDSSTYHAHGNSIIFVFFAVLYTFTFKRLNLSQKMFSGFCLALMGLSIFLTFTRGIWGACFISLLILSFVRSRKFGFIFVAAALIFGFIGYKSFPQMQQRLEHSFTSNSDAVRSQLIHVHWMMFKEHPFLGIGFWDSYRQIADYWPMIGKPRKYFESHSHNQTLNVMATTGLVGLFFFASIAVFFLKESVIYLRQNKTGESFILAFAILLTLIHFFLMCLTDVSFEYAKIRGILVVALAALISFKNRKTKHYE